MENVIRKIVLLACLFLGHGLAHAQDNSPVYKGSEIDLVNLAHGTLYRGIDRQLVAGHLDARRIYQQVRNNPDIWSLEYDLHVDAAVLEDNAIWLRVRGEITAYEVYANGNLVLANGYPGNSVDTEVVGSHLITSRISSRFLNVGENTLTLKFSNFTHPDQGIFRDISLASQEDIHAFNQVMTTAPLLFAGIFIFALFINLGLYYALDRQKIFLSLSILYLLNFIVMVHEVLYWHGIANILPRSESLNFKTISEIMIYTTLVIILHFEFGLKRKYLLVAVLPSLLLMVFTPAVPGMLAMSLAPLFYSLSGMYQRVTGSGLITLSLVGLVVLNVLDGYNLVDNLAFIRGNFLLTSFMFKLDNVGILMFLVIMTAASVKKIMATTNDLQAARLEVQNLEYQFLQKHIQPHFIVNTLTAMQQLISKKPEAANSMIDALSEQFYILANASNKTVIPLSQELDLCREFLKVVSYQQSSSFELYVNGVVGDEMIPPAVFHTIIENGVTHGFSGAESGSFTLSKETLGKTVIYRLVNDGSQGSEKSPHASSGAGTKYIEAKLEAWLPEKWQLNSGPNDGGWETVIKLGECS